MEENKNLVEPGAEEVATEEIKEETVTMSKKDYDKAIQSAEDKVRTSLYKRIHELEDDVKKLKPVEKTDAELELEKRIAALEESEKAVANREKRLATQERLNEKGLDKELIDFLKDDVDIESLSNIFDSMLKNRMKTQGYVPSEHSSEDKVSLDDFRKMTYSQKLEYATKHPESYKRFMAK